MITPKPLARYIRELCALTLLCSLIGYLEWGGEKSASPYRVDEDALVTMLRDPDVTWHAFTVLPAFGQLLLFVSVFLKNHRPWMLYIAIACIGLLFGMVLLIGVRGMNLIAIVSVLPFVFSVKLLLGALARYNNETTPWP